MTATGWASILTTLVGGSLAAYLLAARRALASEETGGEVVSPALAPAPITPSLGTKALEVFQRYVGAKEEPPKSSRGPIVDVLIRGVYNDGEKFLGQAWCARSLRFVYEKAAQELGLPRPFAAVSDPLAAVSKWMDIFKPWQSVTAKPGMAAAIKHGGISHIVLVDHTDGPWLYSWEGNHNDQVAYVRRLTSEFDGFYDIDAYVQRADAPKVSGLDLLGAS